MCFIETDRLKIEEASEKDGLFFLQLLTSPNWLEHIGDRGIKTEIDAINYIENSLIKSYRENGFGLYKVSLKTGDPVGICGFVQREYLDNPDIGFAILPNYERKGLITEAALSIMEYGVNTLGLSEILGITTANNIGSKKVLSKIGLKEIGKIKPNGNEDELLLFSNLDTSN